MRDLGREAYVVGSEPILELFQLFLGLHRNASATRWRIAKQVRRNLRDRGIVLTWPREVILAISSFNGDRDLRSLESLTEHLMLPRILVSDGCDDGRVCRRLVLRRSWNAYGQGGENDDDCRSDDQKRSPSRSHMHPPDGLMSPNLPAF